MQKREVGDADGENNLWEVATKKMLQKAREANGQTTESKGVMVGSIASLAMPLLDTQKIFVFVGEKDAGKTNLIMNYLDIPTVEQPKETIALDFKFGDKARSQASEDKKVRVNVYEVGGGRSLAPLA